MNALTTNPRITLVRRDDEYDLMFEIESTLSDIDAVLTEIEIENIHNEVKEILEYLSRHYSTASLKVESEHFEEYDFDESTNEVTYRMYVDLVEDHLPHETELYKA